MDIGIGTIKRRDRHRGRGATVAAVLALALAVPTGLAPVAAQAAEGGLGRPDLPGQRVSKVKETEGPGARKARAKVAQGEKADAEHARRSKDEQRAAAWPQEGDAIVELRAGKRGKAKPGGLPVTVSPSGGKNSAATGTEARIHVLGQQAAEKVGITGVLLTAEADEAGQAQLSIDYSSFASAVGGDWADRLHLVRLPGCVLDTPDKAACRTTTPLTSDNDRAQQTLVLPEYRKRPAVRNEQAGTVRDDRAPADGRPRSGVPVIVSLLGAGVVAGRDRGAVHDQHGVLRNLL